MAQVSAEKGRWKLSCICVGDLAAFGFGRVLQDLMTAYLAGKERRSQIALTRGPGAGSGGADLPCLGGA